MLDVPESELPEERELSESINRALDKLDYNRLRRLSLRAQTDTNALRHWREAAHREVFEEFPIDAALDGRASHAELLDEVNQSGIGEILHEKHELIRAHISRETLPLLDASITSRAEIDEMIALAQAINHLSESRLGLDWLHQITPAIMLRSAHPPESSPLAHRLHFIAALIKLTGGSGLAAANLALGVLAGAGTALPTLGLGTVAATIGIVTSAYTGLNSAADGLKDLASAIDMRPSQVRAVSGFSFPLAFTNSIGMEFVLIPAGTFMMGSPDSDPDAHDYEKPAHQVTLSQAFYLGKYPVTQAQWEVVMGTNPSRFKGSDRPVEAVSWDNVQAFMRKLNEREGVDHYRLPTEAQWEYACRAGSGTRYHFGDDAIRLGEYAWYEENSGSQTHPVGQKQPNAWGLYDMHGNVWEWVQGKYGRYTAAPVTDPIDLTNVEHVSRGGSWIDPARYVCSAYRRWDPGDHLDYLGFRCLSSGGETRRGA